MPLCKLNVFHVSYKKIDTIGQFDAIYRQIVTRGIMNYDLMNHSHELFPKRKKNVFSDT